MTPLVVVFVLVVVVGSLGAVFWNVLRAAPNSGPALGTDNPYPDGIGVLGPGEEAPTFLPTAIISDAEELRRDAHRHLAERHGQSGIEPARSWMEEPGAMEAAGLVDRAEPVSEDPPSAPDQSRRTPQTEVVSELAHPCYPLGDKSCCGAGKAALNACPVM